MYEKELEDWICANLQRTLEDLNYDEFLAPILASDPIRYSKYIDPPQRESFLVGRQISLPHGRVDILAWNYQPVVIELKTRPIKPKDICQVLRYMADIEMILTHSYLDNALTESIPYVSDRYGRERDHAFCVYDYKFTNVMGWIIGTSVSDDVLAALEIENVYGAIWDQEPDGAFRFTPITLDAFEYDYPREHPDWVRQIFDMANGEIGEELQAYIRPSTWYREGAVLHRGLIGWNIKHSEIEGHHDG